MKRIALFSAALLAASFSPSFAEETTPGAAFSLSENNRFGAVAQGIPGAIAVEASADAKTFAARRDAAIRRATDRRARANIEAQLRRIGALGARTPLSRPRIVAATRDGALPARTAVRRTTRAVGPLFFKLDRAGFTDRQFNDFNNFVNSAGRAYSLMTALYGAPAPSQQNKTVAIVFDAGAGDGLYQLPASGSATSGGTIRYDPITADSFLSETDALRINEYNLARQMLIAFRGPQIIAFDAWELGMTDAAALVVCYQLRPSANFDPSSLGVYLLPLYDLLNRPELGNPFFFSSGTSPNLGFYRAGMAQSAWLKCWVENPNFFARFNAAYYVQFGQTGYPLAGNTPALKNIAAAIVPRVENLNFADWYRRQYVLDTAVTTGEKLWFAVVPQPNLLAGDTRSVFFGIAQRYRTAPSGDETPISGVGSIRATDENGANINLLSDELRLDNRVIFNALGEAELNGQNVPANRTPIIGFAGTGTPDRARLRIVVSAGDAQNDAIFPYNVAGLEGAPTGFYGAVINNRAAQLAISTRNGGFSRNANVTVVRGSFGDGGVYPSAPAVVSTFSLAPTDGAAPKTFVRNGAWSFNGARTQSFATILETAPGNALANAAWNIAGTNNLRMISVPLYPTETDEALALKIDRTRLLLARYRPNLAPKGFTSGGVTFGITSGKHELYPNIAEPLAPGRGYWLKLNANLATTVRGGEPSRAGNFEVPLLGGWNQIGVPFNRAFALSSLRVSYAGTSTTFAQAITNGVLGAGVWRWKPEGGYARVDSGTVANQTLQPFEGYYIYARFARGVKLIFPPNAAASGILPRAATSVRNWSIPLVATSPGARDGDGAFGVTTADANAQRAAARPPSGPRSLVVAFSSSGDSQLDATRAGDASGWAESFLKPGAAPVWNGIIDGAWPEETVSISWGRIADLPVALDATFVDIQSGARIDMAKNSTFRFTSDGTARRFRIETKLRPALVSNFAARALPGSRIAEITANFGVAGRAIVDVETSEGDLVANVSVVQALPGFARWTWNGRDTMGRARPAGNYVAHLRFRDERGVEAERFATFSLQ